MKELDVWNNVNRIDLAIDLRLMNLFTSANVCLEAKTHEFLGRNHMRFLHNMLLNNNAGPHQLRNKTPCQRNSFTSNLQFEINTYTI